jgi:hypothetical protein
MLEICWKDGKCKYLRNVLNDDPGKRQIYGIYDMMVKPVLGLAIYIVTCWNPEEVLPW